MKKRVFIIIAVFVILSSTFYLAGCQDLLEFFGLGDIADELPELADGFARIIGEITPLVAEGLNDLGDAIIEVVGQAGVQTSSVLTNSNNFYYDVNVSKRGSRHSASEYQLLVHDRGRNIGAKRDGISLTAGTTTTLPTSVNLQKTGSISGMVTLSNGSDPTGAFVFIPGTSFNATANASGEFSMTGVPPGTYENVRVQKDGYYDAVVSDVVVTSETNTAIGTMRLILSTGPNGSVLINDGDAYTTNLTVTLTIGATSDAVLMLISENETFTGALWTPIQATTEYTFTNGGTKRLYMKFADANGLESTGVYDDITINTDPSALVLLSPSNGTTIADLQPSFDWSDGEFPGLKYHLQIDDNADYTSPIVDLSTAASGLTSSNYSLTSNLPADTTTYYWRVRTGFDSDGFLGSWFTGSFTFDSRPTYQSPTLGATVNDPQISYSWSGGHTGPGVTYDLQLSQSSVDWSTPLISQTALTVANYTPPGYPLQNDQATYYWRVRSVEGTFTGDWSSTGSFYLDTVPTLTSAASPTANSTPTMEWSDTFAAADYQIQVDDDSAFGSPFVATIVAASTYTPPVLADGIWNWRVRSYKTGDLTDAAWSAADSFEIDTAGPVVTAAPAIDSGATYTHNHTVSVSVTATDQQPTFEMQLSEDASFTGATWIPYSTSASIVLQPHIYSEITDDNRTIYMRFRDLPGNDSAVVTDSIVLDPNVYVSTSGSDSNEGFKDSPLLTISSGMAMSVNQSLRPNEIRVAGSVTTETYVEDSGIDIAPDTSLVGGYSPDFTQRDWLIYATEITSTNRYTLSIEVVSATIGPTRIDGFRVTNSKSFSENVYTIQITFVETPLTDPCVIISHNVISSEGEGNTSFGQNEAATACIFQHGGYWVEISNNEIYGGTGLARNQESAGSAGIFVHGGSATISNNTVIHGGDGSSTAAKSAGSAAIYSSIATVFIHDNVSIHGGTGSSEYSVSAGSAGVYSYAGSVVIESNGVIDGGSGQSSNWTDGAGSAAVFVASNGSLEISRNNIINGGDGTGNIAGSVGILLHHALSTSTIGMNVTVNGGSGSGGSEGSVGVLVGGTTIIANNLVEGGSGLGTGIDAVGILLRNDSRATVVNNVIVADAGSAESAVGISISGLPVYKLGNNMIWATNGTETRYGISANESAIGAAMHNNLFLNGPTEMYYFVDTSVAPTIEGINSLGTATGNITTTQTLAELFIGGTPFDYHLAPGSDAIDAGIDTSAAYWGEVLDDIDGETRPKGSAYDVGIDEY